MIDKIEFTLLLDGRILDLRPMYSNQAPLVYKEGSWVIFEGSTEDIIKSTPIDCDNVKVLTSKHYLS